MKANLFVFMFLISGFAILGNAQPVNTESQEALSEQPVLEATEPEKVSEETQKDGLDPDLKEELTFRLTKHYKTLSLKELQKRKGQLQKQIKKKERSDNLALKEKLNLEMKIINDFIEEAKQPNPSNQK